MKNKFFKYTFLAFLSVGMFTSCVQEDDTDIPTIKTPIILEDFQSVTNNGNIQLEGWLNVAEAGSKTWVGKIYSGNGYAEFSSFGSGDASNVGWLISPKIDLTNDYGIATGNQGKNLAFEVSQHHFDNNANTFQVFISTDFDGTNVQGATWIDISSSLRLPKTDDTWYDFIPAGIYNLSGIEGAFYVAYKAVGNGTTLDGAFMIDNFTIY